MAEKELEIFFKRVLWIIPNITDKLNKISNELTIALDRAKQARKEDIIQDYCSRGEGLNTTLLKQKMENF